MTFPRFWTRLAPAAGVVALMVAGWLLVNGPILNPEQPYTEAANPSGMMARQVWAEPDTDGTGSVSRDGRFLAYNHWSTGNIAIRDLHTGENRVLTKKEGWDWTDYASFPMFSADGTEVAYTWYRYEEKGSAGYELRVVGRDGANDRLIYTNDEVQYMVPKGWFPDGRHVLAWIERKDRTAQIATVSVGDGRLRSIKSLGWNREGPFRLSPDGRWIAYQSRNGIKILAADGSAEHSVADTSEESEVIDWAPDGGSLLFSSERTGEKAIWSIAFQDGFPQSKPTMLKADYGARNAVGIASDGSLYYAITSGGNNIHSTAFDFQSGRLLESPLDPDTKSGRWQP